MYYQSNLKGSPMSGALDINSEKSLSMKITNVDGPVYWNKEESELVFMVSHSYELPGCMNLGLLGQIF